MKKIVSAIILSLVVLSMSTFTFNVRIVKADDEPFYFHSTRGPEYSGYLEDSIDAWVMDFNPPTGTLGSYTSGVGGSDVVFYFGPVASPLTIGSGNWSCYLYVSNTTVSSMYLTIEESNGAWSTSYTVWTSIDWTPKVGWNTITWSDSSSRLVNAGGYLVMDTNHAGTLGSITILWDNDTYDSRLVIPSAQSTSTVVTCSPNRISAGSTVACTATVSGFNPTGTVTWSTNSSTGSFASTTSTLSDGRCSTNYTDSSAGNVTITASYSGDPDNPNNTPSNGSFVLDVMQQYEQTFSVAFNESGLASGFTWWVDLNGENQSSNSTEIDFQVSNGTYAYSAGASGHSASTLTGIVTVSGVDIREQETFTVVPEFPSLTLLSLFVVTAFLAVIIYRKKHSAPRSNEYAMVY